MTYDVARVRAAFPAQAEGAAHFDGPGGSQTAEPVADAVAAAMRAAVANRGVVSRAEQRAEAIVVEARRAVADLLGADPGGVVFGKSMTALTFDISRALAATWTAGDEIVVSRLDHDANIRPWVVAAERSGVTVRWADFDPTTAELDVPVVRSVLSDRTKLVAVTAASNLFGTVPDVAAIAAAVHGVGALLFVDGVHRVPHTPVDVGALGADFFVCSAYKFCGPHVSALVAQPALLETLHPDKLLPSTEDVPERFELGTLPYEQLAGFTAAVDFLSALAPDATGDRRQRVIASMTALEEYERALVGRLESGLHEVPGVVLHGRPRRRTPTLLFSVDGWTGRDVQVKLAESGVNAPAGSFYALEAARWAGLGDAGAVRAGLAPYSNDDDVSRLLIALREGCCPPGRAARTSAERGRPSG